MGDRPARWVDAIKANVHPAAHHAVSDWESFPWHTYRGRPDSHVRHSSQALCMSVWGTVANPDARPVRRVLAELVDPDLGSAVTSSVPNVRFEHVDRDVLNEHGGGIPTTIDAYLELPGMVCAVESKLSEAFGGCGQVRQGHCTGRYESGSDRKTGTGAGCRLTVPDGRRSPRRYFDVMETLAAADAIEPGGRCPFAGSGYQVMRTVAFAAGKAAAGGIDWRAVFAFPAAFRPESVAAVDAIRSLLAPPYRQCVLVLDYVVLAHQLAGEDDPTAQSLAAHLQSRLDHVADRRR